ncbi:MAG: leucine-rich repeat domain-containing protein [Clostridia bacterium]|nr:leucine-rich repeat domain-containing protein [Clostridia bacterium]
MKRKLLLFIIAVACFMCIFAVCIGASTIYKDTQGNQLFRLEADSSGVITSYEGEFPKTDENGNALTWYVTATGTEGENTVKTVDCVLTTDSAHFSITNGKYSYIGSTVTQYNVVSVNFPNDAGITSLGLAHDGYRGSSVYTFSPNATEILFVYLPKTLTSLPSRFGQGSKILICQIPDEVSVSVISHVMFHDARCLREINIPSSVTEISGKSKNDGAAFYNAVSLEKVTFASNDNLTTIGNMAFHQTGLKYVTIPDSVTTIGEHAFSYTSIIDSPFTESSRLTTVGGRAFSNISTLKTFIVPATITSAVILGTDDYGPLAESTVELVTYGNSAPITEMPRCFFGRAIIGKIILPNGPTEIPERYFINSKIQDVQFSDTIVTARERVFQNATVEVIRLGKNFKHFTNGYQNHHSFVFNAVGLKEMYIPASFYKDAPDTAYQVSYAFQCGSSNNIKFFYTGTAEELAVAMDNFKNTTTSSGDNNGKFTGATQISWSEYSANSESYASGNYIIYDYGVCDAFYGGEHNISVAINYPRLDKEGTRITGCTNAGCKNNTTETLPALIECRGFSSPENGAGSIAIGYSVNENAIAFYEEATGSAISYGAFAISEKKLGAGDVLNTDGAIVVDMTQYKHVAFELKISGFTTEEQKSANLCLGAYVIATTDDENEVFYIQATDPNEGAKYSYVTYNDFVK